MIRVENQEAVRNARDASGVIQGTAVVNQMRPEFMPVLDCTPDFHRTLSTWAAGSSVTGTFTAYTGRPRKQLFILGAYVSMAKSATCDMSTGSVGLTFSQGGVTQTLLSIASTTLTQFEQSVYISFPYPIAVDTNTDVSFAATFTAGSLRRTTILYGYELNTE